MKNKLKSAVIAIGIASALVFVAHRVLPSKAKRGPAIVSRLSTVNKYSPILRLVLANKGRCSGAVLSAQYAVTAAHCLIDEDTDKLIKADIKVYSIAANGQSSNGHFIIAKPVAASGQLDYALIAGDFSEFMNLPSNTQTPELFAGLNEPHAICGFPMGRAEVFCVPFEAQDVFGFFVHGHSGPIQPGMSGGAVINVLRGTIDGVVIAVSGNQTLVTSVFNLFSAFEIELQ